MTKELNPERAKELLAKLSASDPTEERLLKVARNEMPELDELITRYALKTGRDPTDRGVRRELFWRLGDDYDRWPVMNTSGGIKSFFDQAENVSTLTAAINILADYIAAGGEVNITRDRFVKELPRLCPGYIYYVDLYGKPLPTEQVYTWIDYVVRHPARMHSTGLPKLEQAPTGL